LPLMPGTYCLDLWLNSGTENVDLLHEAISFEVLPADIFGTGQLPGSECGPVIWPATFSIENSAVADNYVASA
jgi:hypothetical protein